MGEMNINKLIRKRRTERGKIKKISKVSEQNGAATIELGL